MGHFPITHMAINPSSLGSYDNTSLLYKFIYIVDTCKLLMGLPELIIDLKFDSAMSPHFRAIMITLPGEFEFTTISNGLWINLKGLKFKIPSLNYSSP